MDGASVGTTGLRIPTAPMIPISFFHLSRTTSMISIRPDIIWQPPWPLLEETKEIKRIFSYTYTDAAGVVPENALGRHSINLRLTNKLTDKLTSGFLKSTTSGRTLINQLAQGENFSNPNRHIMRLPRNIATEDISRFEYTNASGLLRQNYFNPGSNGGANPYWTINRNLRRNTFPIGL